MSQRRQQKLSKDEIKEIAESLADILDDRFEKLQDAVERSVARTEFEKVKANVRVNRYNFDRLEQYTRRENIRIHNWSFDDKASLTPQVVDLLNSIAKLEAKEENSMVVLFTENDISTCHPIGNGAKRQVIVRFISRAKVMDVFKVKRQLKAAKHESLKKIFITEDLTKLRLRLKDVVKSTEGTSAVFTKNGDVHCTYKGKHTVVASPDDLFKIGLDSIDLEALGLKDLE